MSLRNTALRRLVAGLCALALAGSLAACADSETTEATAGKSTKADGPWEFTDDRGTKISLPKRPKRIVAQSHAAAALWDFGVEPVGVFGPQKRPDGSPDPQIGNVDLAKVTSVGSNFGEFNLEKYAGLKPDLVVTIMYGSALWYVPDESKEKIEGIAPVVGIKLDGVSAADAITRFGELAKSLGADLDSDAVTTARGDFERASDKVKEAAKSTSGLTVGMVIGQQDGYWVADPTWHGDAKYFTELGLDVVAPEKPDSAYGFEMLSWEQAGTYPADLLLEDARTVGLTTDQLAEKFPTWTLLPAVKARQVGAWHAETPSSYALYVQVLLDLAATVAKAKTDVVA